MSDRSKLEQVLELLLAEDNERAEELLHEYVVETARAEYERILDEDEVVAEEESEEEAVEEAEESEEEAVEEDAVEEFVDHSDPEQDLFPTLKKQTMISKATKSAKKAKTKAKVKKILKTKLIL